MNGVQFDVDIRRDAFHLQVAGQVRPGETLAVIGPNGAGKTTLLRTLAGLLPLDGGYIRCDDVTWDDPTTSTFVEPAHRGAPLVFQDYRLFPHLTVTDNVAYGLRTRRLSAKDIEQRTQEALARFGVADLGARRPRQLSGGQAQRVALARALVTEPRVLLLDEPLASLDATTRHTARLALKAALSSFDGPTILITHDPVEALTLPDRLLVLEAGRMTQVGPPPAVAARPLSEYGARLVGLNLFTGALSSANTITVDGGGVFHLPQLDASPGTAMLVTLPPNAIALHHDRPADTSARNIWSGRIRGVEHLHDRLRVDVDASPSCLVDVTAAAFTQLGLDVDADVWLSAKATEVVAYPAPNTGN